MANSVPSTNGVVVVTHVYPQQGAQSFTSPQNGVVSTPPSLLGQFLKGEPVALGTVQIMIAVVIFLFGIVTTISATTISAFSGYMFWGAIIYITAGSLTVRANKNLNSCLVKASMVMNIFSTITALLAIILNSLDIALTIYPYYGGCGNNYDCYTIEDLFWSRSKGISGVMLVLSVLEFIVSICVSAFACKATCCTTTNAQVIYQVPPSVFSSSPLSAPPVNTFSMPSFQTSVMPPAHHSGADGLKLDTPENLPPIYTAVQ